MLSRAASDFAHCVQIIALFIAAPCMSKRAELNTTSSRFQWQTPPGRASASIEHL